ncbi:MAG: hypothetical protein H6579_10820 [Chitinophagales bacterium]|nr:hypothetical protein [Chitinophagales bacterium]
MEEKEIDFSNIDELIKHGAINVLAMGYRGIDLWREKRTPPEKKKKDDEEKA